LAALGGTEVGDGPPGNGDRELLAGLGSPKHVGDVVAQFLLGDHRHENHGSRTAT
jgi:hypothetical protein